MKGRAGLGLRAWAELSDSSHNIPRRDGIAQELSRAEPKRAGRIPYAPSDDDDGDIGGRRFLVQMLGEYPARFPEQSYVDQDGARGKAGVEKRQHAAHIRDALNCESVTLQIGN